MTNQNLSKAKEAKNDIQYHNSTDIIDDARLIINEARNYAYSAINVALVRRNWFLGKRIAKKS